jgi:hypothetical protein
MFKIKKLLLLVLIATIVFSCFFPFEAISAFWSEAYDLISDPIGTISAAIMNVIIDIVAGICEFILGLASQMLTWSITAGGIDQTGRESPAVTEGWNLTRGLANSALIIGLVIIAINIILGKEEEQAKKTLINFVIIALLINFTPLICGFLIEGANIIARGFVGEGITNEMSNQLLNGLASVKNGNLLETLILVLFLLVFSIISFVVHILYSLLFLARTVILWILIIVSPIALATKVFPKSNAVKKFFPSILYWDDWYEMFLQWVIIVVPAAIFIHLSNIVIRASIVTEPIKESESLGNYLMNMGFSLMLPLIFLIVGFMVTISSGGKIAAPIGGLGKKAWAATAGAAGGYAIGKAKAGAKATGTWAKEGAIGTTAALFTGQNPLSKEGRDIGRAEVDKAKAKVSGVVGKGKDYLRIGEENTWAKRSAETEKQLKEGMDDYFDGTPEENVAKFKMAQQQIEKERISGSLSKKDLSRQAENLFVAAANNGDIEDDAILEFLEASKTKGIEVDYGKMLRGTSATEIIKKFKPTALERGFIAKELVETPQGEFIRQDRRSTQAHSVALIKGIEKSKSTEAQSKAALDIGSTLSPGDYKNNYEQIVTAKLDQLREKEQREGLTDKEKEQAANMAEFLRK